VHASHHPIISALVRLRQTLSLKAYCDKSKTNPGLSLRTTRTPISSLRSLPQVGTQGISLARTLHPQPVSETAEHKLSFERA
jgi:hypothetical protein